MKYIFFSLFATLLALGGKAQIQSVNLEAGGLTCSMCSKAIYEALIKVAAVREVKADIAHSSYNIQFKPGAAIVPEDLKNAVKNAGFSVVSLQVKALLNNVDVHGDAQISVSNVQFQLVQAPQQKLNGEVLLRVIDKDYLPEKERRKFAAPTAGAPAADAHIYRVTLQQS